MVKIVMRLHEFAEKFKEKELKELSLLPSHNN